MFSRVLEGKSKLSCWREGFVHFFWLGRCLLVLLCFVFELLGVVFVCVFLRGKVSFLVCVFLFRCLLKGCVCFF